MYKPTIGITPEGWPTIGLCALATLSCALLGWEIFSVLALLFTLFSCHFFRDPERVIPRDEDCAVSPADGNVIYITQAVDPFTKEQCQCIAIFMNVFSVHVNRSPIASTVTAIKYYPGTFVNASLDKAARDNERCAYSLKDGDDNHWSMVQISGLIARRIVCRTSQGSTLSRGERFGMIKFGSRVDVYIPAGYVPAITVGDSVFAGQSIIAKKR